MSVEQVINDALAFSREEQLQVARVSVDGVSTDDFSVEDQTWFEELERRFADLESGKDPGCTWEEVKASARAAARCE